MTRIATPRTGPELIKPLVWATITGFFLMSSGAALSESDDSQPPGSNDRMATVQSVTSPSGITAYLAENDTVPVVSIHFSFDGGIETDPAGKEGRANLVTTLLDEGAGDLSGREFQQRLADLSISMRFSAGIERVSGSIYTVKDNLGEALDLLALALGEPSFEPEAVERMRDSVAGSIRSNTGNPNWIARRAFLERLLGDHPYARPSRGTMETLYAIEVEDLRQFVDERFTRDGLTVAAAGDISGRELEDALDRAFGHLPDRGEPAEIPSWDGLQDTFGVVIERDGPQSNLILAQPGISRDDPDYYAALVMNHVLGGGGFGSRLTQEIRERRGLTYGIGSGFYTTRSVDMIMVNSSLAHENVSQAIELIRAEWERMRDDGISEDELSDAKRYITGSFPLQLTSTRDISSMLLTMQLWELGENYIRERNALIENVTLEDVNRVAADLLDPDRFSFAIVGQPPADFPADERFPASRIVDRELGR